MKNYEERECGARDCSQVFKPKSKINRYCSRECCSRENIAASAGKMQGEKGLVCPVKERRLRKLGQAVPEGFIEAMMKGVLKHGKEMPRWTYPDLAWTAAFESGQMKFPLTDNIPEGWPAGMEDFADIAASPRFQRVMEKYQLEIEYVVKDGVSSVLFRKTT